MGPGPARAGPGPNCAGDGKRAPCRRILLSELPTAEDVGMSTATPTQTADAIDVRVLRNYIGGRFVEAATSEHLDVTEPATGEPLARVPLSSAADLDDAVRAAQEAFTTWRRVPHDRARAPHVHAAPGALENQERIAHSSPRRWARRSPTRSPRSAARSRWSSAPPPCPRRCRAATSRTSRRPSTARPIASRSACSGRSARSTSRRWCPCGSCRSRSPAATRSCSSPPSRSPSRRRRSSS